MKIDCPNKQCTSTSKIIRQGFYIRACDSKKIQRFKCKSCGENFSSATGKREYRFRKRREIPLIRHLLCSNTSLQRIAKIAKVNRKTVTQKLIYLAELSNEAHLKYLKSRGDEEKNKRLLSEGIIKHGVGNVRTIQFDDLITLEDTKMKPLTVTVAIEKQTRTVLSIKVAQIPSFGHLAKRSKEKYGKRKNYHKEALKGVFDELKLCTSSENILFESDEHKFYPEFVKKYFPKAHYQTYKGAKGAVSGMGELKKIKYDPLFSINHTMAMLRYNIARLARKTWCQSKRLKFLQHHLDVYKTYHNIELLPAVPG